MVSELVGRLRDKRFISDEAKARMPEEVSDLLFLFRREREEAADRIEALEAALEPFARVGQSFSWAIGPDGIDDDLTVIVEPVARREWAQHLSTVNFTNAAKLGRSP